jgi:DNA ligase-1
LKEKPANVEVEKKFIPDNWVKPSIIVEIGGDEISKSKDHSTGYALRFPRLIKLRPDKKAVDATTSKEIETLHNMQKRGYY